MASHSHWLVAETPRCRAHARAGEWAPRLAVIVNIEDGDADEVQGRLSLRPQAM